jgi:hypothetical protein
MQAKWNEKFRGIAFVLVAIIGLTYVKWVPYYAKAFFAQSHHAIGDSILVGRSFSAPLVSWNAALDYGIAYGKAIWSALILGLVLGSGIKVLLPHQWVNAMFGRLGFRGVALGSFFAIPCMLCTCCAAPVAVGLRQSRASIGSVVSWWMSNPILNPATLVFMGFVLGWGWAIFRIVFGLVMVFAVAYLAERYAEPHEAITLEPRSTFHIKPVEGSLLVRWAREFMTLTIRLVPEYLILVLLLGAARIWLFPVLGAHAGIGWIILMALAGTLFVVPTAGEVPIVQTMIALGMGVGPAGALIMTLPAVSLPSLVMLGRVFSLRIRLVIATGVVLSGIVAGLIAPFLF